MKVWSVFAVVALAAAFAMAQEKAFTNEPPATSGDAVFTSETHLVELAATVTGPDGHLLTDLPQSDFHVFENDVPQEIKLFKREDAPISMGLLIDASGSMGDKREKVAKAALTLVRASNPSDEVFVMGFNDKPWLAQEFTHNIGEMEAALEGMKPSGATAMRDAVALALAHDKRLAHHQKKVILVVTDGDDNSSLVRLDQLTRDAQQYGVLIYAIGLLSDTNQREAERARTDLDTLTVATGGEVFYPKELSEVDEIARHVAHDLRNQYTIAYDPSNKKLDSTFRRIKLTVDRPEGAKVRTRTGYYADPPRS
jgi:VWFA-related protein